MFFDNSHLAVVYSACSTIRDEDVAEVAKDLHGSIRYLEEELRASVGFQWTDILKIATVSSDLRELEEKEIYQMLASELKLLPNIEGSGDVDVEKLQSDIQGLVDFSPLEEDDHYWVVGREALLGLLGDWAKANRPEILQFATQRLRAIRAVLEKARFLEWEDDFTYLYSQVSALCIYPQPLVMRPLTDLHELFINLFARQGKRPVVAQPEEMDFGRPSLPE